MTEVGVMALLRRYWWVGVLVAAPPRARRLGVAGLGDDDTGLKLDR